LARIVTGIPAIMTTNFANATPIFSCRDAEIGRGMIWNTIYETTTTTK
jgi:hypothetical protein